MRKILFATYVVDSKPDYINAAKDYSGNTVREIDVVYPKEFPSLVVFLPIRSEDTNSVRSSKVPIRILAEVIKEYE